MQLSAEAAGPGLSQPFNHSAVIEDTLLAAFPRVWQGVYYFDPRRGKGAEHEANTIYSLVKHNHGIRDGRPLQEFSNNVMRAVRDGCGMTIPFSGVACYLMTERDKTKARLTHFFGEAAMRGQNIRKLGRLFEEYVARHEMYHGVERLEPGFTGSQTIRPLVESENEADAYAILSMFREHGKIIFPFATLVITARDHQYARDRLESENSARNYLTQGAIRSVIDYVCETGAETLRDLDERAIFRTARRLGAEGARQALRV